MSLNYDLKLNSKKETRFYQCDQIIECPGQANAYVAEFLKLKN